MILFQHDIRMIKNFSPNSFVLGLVLGGLLTGAWFLGFNSVLTSAPPGRVSSTAPNQAFTSEAIAVSDQKAGSEVVIESLAVPLSGVWVAVRETNGNELGNVLGAVRVRGSLTNVSVPLLRATEPNRPYAVQLYRDDNNDAFDPSSNSVYVDFDTGARVVAYFKTVN